MKTIYDEDTGEEEVKKADVWKDDEELQRDYEKLQTLKASKQIPVPPPDTEESEEDLLGYDEESDEDYEEDSEPNNEAREKIKLSKEKLQEYQQKGLSALIDIVASIGIRVRKIAPEDQEAWRAEFHEMADGISFLLVGEDIGEILGSFATKTKPTTKIFILIGFLVLMMFLTPAPSHTSDNVSKQSNANTAQSTTQAIPVLNVGRFSIYGGGR